MKEKYFSFYIVPQPRHIRAQTRVRYESSIHVNPAIYTSVFYQGFQVGILAVHINPLAIEVLGQAILETGFFLSILSSIG